MKNLFYLLFALPLLFSCGGAKNDASDDIKKESSICKFVEIQKDMFKDILSGMPIDEANRKYAKSKEEYIIMFEENKEEFKECAKSDDELNSLSTKVMDFAKKNRIQEVEGIFLNIMIDDSEFE
jgi:hypothetical protein